MLTLSMDIRTTSRKLVENRMKREQEIAGRVAGRIHKSFKGDVSAHRLLDETGSFRGALYALAGIVRDYFDGTVSRKMSMAIMGVGDTVRRMEDAEMSMAASAKTGVSSFVDPEGKPNLNRRAIAVFRKKFNGFMAGIDEVRYRLGEVDDNITSDSKLQDAKNELLFLAIAAEDLALSLKLAAKSYRQTAENL
jgi:hypothetical protein